LSIACPFIHSSIRSSFFTGSLEAETFEVRTLKVKALQLPDKNEEGRTVSCFPCSMLNAQCVHDPGLPDVDSNHPDKQRAMDDLAIFIMDNDMTAKARTPENLLCP
jgi:hypothetical protein